MSETPNLWDDPVEWGRPECYTTIQAADIDGDGRAELLARAGAGIQAAKWDPGTRAWVRLADGPALSDDGGWTNMQYYRTIQCADIDGDGQAELLARTGAGIRLWKYIVADNSWLPLPNGPEWRDAYNWNLEECYSTIQCADIDGDGQAELLARSQEGIVAWKFDKSGNLWRPLPAGPPWSDAAGWTRPELYSTIQCADIDGDGQAELLARGSAGIVVWKFDQSAKHWGRLPDGPTWPDADGWTLPQYYSTIQCADIDRDGQAELLARTKAGIVAWKFDKSANIWRRLADGPAWSDADGWGQIQYYSTIQCLDFNGDGQAEILGMDDEGIRTCQYDIDKGKWHREQSGPSWGTAADWNLPQYYSTIQGAELDGYGQDELIARGYLGMQVWEIDPLTVTTWQDVLQQAVVDPVFRQRLDNNPIQVLHEQGVDIPPARQQLATAMVKLILKPPRSKESVSHFEPRSTSAVTDSQYISASADWYGLSIHLSPQAATDASNGVNLQASLGAAIAVAAGSNLIPEALVVSGAIPGVNICVGMVVAYLWGLGSWIGLMNRGNGVNLIVPWTSFIPFPFPSTYGVVIPIPA